MSDFSTFPPHPPSCHPNFRLSHGIDRAADGPTTHPSRSFQQPADQRQRLGHRRHARRHLAAPAVTTAQGTADDAQPRFPDRVDHVRAWKGPGIAKFFI